MIVKICKIFCCAPWRSDYTLSVCDKFANEFFVCIVKKIFFPKNCPNRPKTAFFCPDGSKMAVKSFSGITMLN